jgi:hypothetical protein
MQKARYLYVLGTLMLATGAVGLILFAFAGVKPVQTAVAVAADTDAMAAPGLVITGYVRLAGSPGSGLGEVAIYRSYAAYAGTQIAQTDSAGYYDSGYYYIPGDEMVTVWGVQAGYNLDPQQYHWRHYYGYEARTMDFLATPLRTNCTVPPTPNRIWVDRGSWETQAMQHELQIVAGEGVQVLTVTSEAGTVVAPSTGAITIPLLANTLHHVQVAVRMQQPEGCFYVTGTAYDYQGLPLTIRQVLSPTHYYLPLVANRP